jgi:hypothetical protein
LFLYLFLEILLESYNFRAPCSLDRDYPNGDRQAKVAVPKREGKGGGGASISEALARLYGPPGSPEAGRTSNFPSIIRKTADDVRN